MIRVIAAALAVISPTAVLANHHHVHAPEIDGPAGLAALAILGATAVLWWERK